MSRVPQPKQQTTIMTMMIRIPIKLALVAATPVATPVATAASVEMLSSSCYAVFEVVTFSN